MCGICAIYNRINPKEKVASIASLVNDLSHRGPDDQGVYTCDKVQLGISRLAIVDVDHGKQPLTNETNTLWLVGNGEIYNHQTLRDELIGQGHRFRTGSDFEVILHLYEEHGISFLSSLAGMFAFVLWDAEKKQMLVVRDRVGIKPLYYYATDESIIFSSEFKSLVKHCGLSSKLTDHHVWEYLCYGFSVNNEHTLDSRIKRLSPGEYIMVSDSGMEKKNYWQPAYLNGRNSRSQLDIKKLISSWEKVLREYFECEVPSGLMLSGGMDSGAIAAFGARMGFLPPYVAMGYQGDFNIDERDKAQVTADFVQGKLTTLESGYSDYSNAFSELIHYMDEPVADIAAIPQWMIFKYARLNNIKVLFNGLGGDELFYGYPVWNEAAQAKAQNGLPRYFETDDASGLFHHPAYRAGRSFLDFCALPNFKTASLGRDDAIAKRYQLDSMGEADKLFHTIFCTWLPNNCLHLGDRLSMAHGVELRVPLLDHRLIDAVQQLPLSVRFDGQNGKVLLKRMLKNVLPEDIINRPKLGFTPPGPFFKKLILENKEIIFEGYLSTHFLDKKKMEKQWGKFTQLEIWFRILVFEKWLETTYV